MRLLTILRWALPAVVLQLFPITGIAQGPVPPVPPVAPGTMGPDGAYRAGNGVTPPTVLTRVGPGIPALAEKFRASGDVLLSVVVRTDGSLRDIEILKSAGYGMDERAIETVKKWRFKAGAKDGIPVDVRLQAGLAFRVAPEANTWGAGPLRFDLASGVLPPALKSGSMPKAVRETGDECVLLQFTVDGRGQVRDIQTLPGEGSTSLPKLISSLATWKFEPASNGTESLPVTGKVLLIKGEDQFRYNVSSAFRDTGTVGPADRKPMEFGSAPGAAPANSGQMKTIVPKLRMEPEEAKKQLLDHNPVQYPDAPRLAGVQGTVLLTVVIGVDGRVKDVQAISGPPELFLAATEAVKQWRYRPTLFRGHKMEVSTEVEIPFKLPK